MKAELPDAAVTRVKPDGGTSVPDGAVEWDWMAMASTLAAVVIPEAEQSVLARELDAVDSQSVAAVGANVLIPVAGIHVHRQLVETLNDRVICCDPVDSPVPTQIATRRLVAPST
jgi:hypothetical protein